MKDGDEFRWLADSAARVGRADELPAVRRHEADVEHTLSSLVWGDADPVACFLHGGGQNAHTWDATILALDEPSVAVDLPGHGRSAWRPDRDYHPRTNAKAVADLLDRYPPRPRAVVGMSLGGLTGIHLAALRPDLVSFLCVLDVTPNSGRRVAAMSTQERGSVALLGGPRSFESFEEMLSHVASVTPGRSMKSLEASIWHNAFEQPDGRWMWRSDLHAGEGNWSPYDHKDSWAEVEKIQAPVMLMAGHSGVVTNSDCEEFVRRCPSASIIRVDTATHSLQGAVPEVIAEVIAGHLADRAARQNPPLSPSTVGGSIQARIAQ